MSRIGKLPIKVPAGVEVKMSKTGVTVKGPKGTLEVNHGGRVDVKLEDGKVQVARFGDDRHNKAFHGLYQRLISNMVSGVTAGFTKELEIQGIGYKAEVKGNALLLNLGFSHQITFPTPAGVKITAPKPTSILVEGADKQLVGQVAANIRSLRPPEPYGGKGIRYVGERVIIKEGKKGTK